MSKIHTHYDNLRVARNAPAEVIRAAYMALSKKIHPDLNPNNPEAARVMAIINESYNVLSDPIKRKSHDIWISEQENESNKRMPKHNQPSSANGLPKSKKITKNDKTISHFSRYWILYGIAVLVFLSLFAKNPIQSTPRSRHYVANDPPVSPSVPVYVRPTTAPNGSPWPVVAGYVQGYEKLHRDGLSSITVDNSQNDSDVYVKLVALENDRAYPVRQFFIPVASKFTLKNVRAGTYDIRYRDLSNGGLSRSESFTLVETETEDGIQYKNMTMTLYKVVNGNMQTYGLSESEF